MEIKVFEVPAGQKRAGYWTFAIDGQESLFYSSSEDGAWRQVRRLLDGPKPGNVTLPVMKASAKQKLSPQEQRKAVAEQQALYALPTREARVAAFLRRGKLGAGGMK